MKVTPKDYESLRVAIEPLDTPELRARYLDGDFPRADAVRNLDMRYRWDLLWLAGGLFLIGGYCRADRPDYNDKHVDTALRGIVPAL